MNILNNCLRHRKHATKQAAQAAAKLPGRRGIAYSCKVGGEQHWHVGRGKRR